MKWAYGLTTCSERLGTHLPRTLASLDSAGFSQPWLFIDGPCSFTERVTVHDPPLLTFGNWLLGIWELFIREPFADRYAMFQDDLVAYRNLRQYLEQVPIPAKCYGNLYTFPQNQLICDRDKGRVGWHQTDQNGLGAVALVFNHEQVEVLLKSGHNVQKACSPDWRRTCALDGGVVEAFNQAGLYEAVHNPSLVQHTGTETTVIDSQGRRNNAHPSAPSFRGEDFDALELLGEVAATTGVSYIARRFVGNWEIRTGNGNVSSRLKIYEDLTAIRSHAPYLPGKVQLVGDSEAQISWVDGHRDKIVINHDHIATFYGMGVEAPWTAIPRLELRAIKTL